MKIKTFLPFGILAIFSLGFIWYLSTGKKINSEKKSVEVINRLETITESGQQPAPTPLAVIVKSKDKTKIVIDSPRGKGETITISRELSGIKYFFRVGSGLVPASYDNVKSGQIVTYTSAEQGLGGVLIIEK